jgi:hypothetical protein
VEPQLGPIDRASLSPVGTVDNVLNYDSYINIPLSHATAWLVELVCYMPEGRGFYSR